MPHYSIRQDGKWWSIIIVVGSYARPLPTQYATREAAQRGMLALLGH